MPITHVLTECPMDRPSVRSNAYDNAEISSDVRIEFVGSEQSASSHALDGGESRFCSSSTSTLIHFPQSGWPARQASGFRPGNLGPSVGSLCGAPRQA